MPCLVLTVYKSPTSSLTRCSNITEFGTDIALLKLQRGKIVSPFLQDLKDLYLAIFIVELGVLNLYINIYNLKRPKAKIPLTALLVVFVGAIDYINK